MSAHSHRGKRAGWRSRRHTDPFAAVAGEKSLPEALAELGVPGGQVTDTRHEAPARIPEGAYPYEDIPVAEAEPGSPGWMHAPGRPVPQWATPVPEVLRQTLHGLRNLDVSGSSHPFDASPPAAVREMLSALPERAAEPRPAVSPAQAFRDDKRTLPVFRGTVRQCGMSGLLRLPYQPPALAPLRLVQDVAVAELEAPYRREGVSVMSAIAERVAKGAQFLDERDPDWWRADADRAIDLDRLNLAAMDSCILGQRCPVSVLAAYFGESEPGELVSSDWVYAYRAYGHHLSGIGGHLRLADWARGLGFNADGGPGEQDEFRALTDEWRRIITERRSAS